MAWDKHTICSLGTREYQVSFFEVSSIWGNIFFLEMVNARSSSSTAFIMCCSIQTNIWFKILPFTFGCISFTVLHYLLLWHSTYLNLAAYDCFLSGSEEQWESLCSCLLCTFWVFSWSKWSSVSTIGCFWTDIL